MKLYYRISDSSYEKSKLIGTSKEYCLVNFCKAFAEEIFPNPSIRIICDNCNEETINMISSSGLPFIKTSLGNAGSLRKSLELAMEEDDEEIVYFCEDDYLHLGSAPKLLKEGIKRADYVTLYDHPDKYTRYYNGGEVSKVIKTASSHWRYTASTCMTFCTKVKTLKEDKEIWFDKDLTGGSHPFDHHIFNTLNKKGRRLAVPIPGVACHVDLAFSGQINLMTIEHWAIDMVIKDMKHKLEQLTTEKTSESVKALIKEKTGSELLLALDAAIQLTLSNS